MSKVRKLDVFALLRAVDRRDGNWLAAQSVEARKEFAPLVAMRWATAANDSTESAYMLWLINQRVNYHLFDLAQHPDLSFRLLASCGLDAGSLKYKWLPGPRQSRNNMALGLLAEHHPTANDRELRMLMSLHTRDSFAEFATDCGKGKDEVTRLLKAYDNL